MYQQATPAELETFAALFEKATHAKLVPPAMQTPARWISVIDQRVRRHALAILEWSRIAGKNPETYDPQKENQ